MQFKLLRDQKVFKRHHSEILNKYLAENAYPLAKETELLARRLDLNVMQVNLWFQHQHSRRNISKESGESVTQTCMHY